MELHGRTGTNSRGIINKPVTPDGTRSRPRGLFETRDPELHSRRSLSNKARTVESCQRARRYRIAPPFTSSDQNTKRRSFMPRISEGEMKTMTRILTITLALIFALGP